MADLTREIRVQAGTQSAFATGVAPSVQLRGIEELAIRSQNEVTMLEDMTLGLAGASQAVVAGIGGEGAVTAWCSYEHLAYWLDNLFGQATPSGANPYVRAYAAPTTTAPTPRILSLVKGTSTGSYRLVGALLSSMTLRQEQGRPLMLNGDLVGNKVNTQALGSLADATVNPIMANHVATIKYDTWAGTMGGTALNNCFVRMWELTVEPDRALRPCFGSLSKDDYAERSWTGTLRLSLEFNATTKTDVDNVIGGTLTQKQVELNYANTAARALQLQFAGTVTEDMEIFGDDDGVVSVEMVLTRTYHSTFANWLKMSLTNAVQTLT